MFGIGPVEKEPKDGFATAGMSTAPFTRAAFVMAGLGSAFCVVRKYWTKRAAAPDTIRPDMLVPPQQMWYASMFCQHQVGGAWLERADALHPPGATMSGLIRPSAAAPRLLDTTQA